MKKKDLKFLGVSAINLLLVASCMPENNTILNKVTVPYNNKSNIKLNTVLSGKVDFENTQNKFKTKATLSLIGTEASVTLSYLPSSSSFPNKIVATGLTNRIGSFKLAPNSNFTPNKDEVFILSSMKRVTGVGSTQLSLQTYVKWNGNSWDSITYPEVVINTKTTAITIMSNYNPTSITPSSTIKAIEIFQSELVSNPLIIVKDINTTNATKLKVLELANTISDLILGNYDPYEYIAFENNLYVIKDNIAKSPVANFTGKVLDRSGVPVDGAKIKAIAVDPGVTWSEEQVTSGGAFIFKNAPIGARILLTVTQDGWTTRQRVEVLTSNLSGDPLANKFDFDGIYAIQDEPEITSIKVNTKSATGTGAKNKPLVDALSTSPTNLNGLDNGNLEIEMNFSEPVRTDDVENSFRVISQNFAVKANKNFVIDKSIDGSRFEWTNNDQTVKFMTNQAILANSTGNEARYMLDFNQAFRDKTDKEAITGKFIRFNPANSSDFSIFSIKNDETDPRLLSITAADGGTSNDIIILKFSEAMNLINRQSDELSLADPLDPTNTKRQLRLHQTNNSGNNQTVLGYSRVDNSLSIGDFIAVYTIARFVPPIAFNQPLIPLKINGVNAGSMINGITSVATRITGSTVLLEFPSTAFDRNDRVIVGVGKTISGTYQDLTNGISFFFDTPLLGITKATVSDPSGRTISTANTSTLNSITVNDSQRVAIVI